MFGGALLTTKSVTATRVTASGTADPSQQGQRMPIRVLNPDPGGVASTDAVTVLVGSETCNSPVVTASVAARFLEQAAFGPDAATVAHVQCIGLEGYIAEQFTEPVSPYPDPGATGYALGQVQARFFSNAVHGRDQMSPARRFCTGADLRGVRD